MKYSSRNTLPPGPTRISPLGHYSQFRSDSLSFLKELTLKYGDIVRFKIGPYQVVLINHPDHIKEVLSVQHQNFTKGRPLEMAKPLLGNGLLTSEGEYHNRHSKIIQPAFHRRIIQKYAVEMAQLSKVMCSSWRDGERLDIRTEMIKLSMLIAGRTLFSTDLRDECEEINNALDDVVSLFGRVTTPFAEVLLKLPTPSTIRFWRAKKRIDKTVYRIIRERQNTTRKKEDVLSLLLGPQSDGDPLTLEEIRDEAVTLLLTAFDTTSNALSWTWYLLSQNPEVESKLHETLDKVLAGNSPTVDDIPKLGYVRDVMAEAMRIYPPTYIIARKAIKDVVIDGYVIPSGSLVLVSPYLIHHDERFYQNPEVFDPDKWQNHSDKTSSKYEYIPFGAGPRSCLGQSYAWMEGVIVLATIAQSWSIKLVPGHVVEGAQLLNYRPKYGLKMTVHQR